jgi:hypothetical protein
VSITSALFVVKLAWYVIGLGVFTLQFHLSDYLWQVDSFALMNNSRTYFSKETLFVFESIEIEPDIESRKLMGKCIFVNVLPENIFKILSGLHLH